MELPVEHPCAAMRVTSLCTDSREAQPGAVFFARAGQRHDGRAYIAEAAERGAVVAVVSDAGTVTDAPVPLVEVDDFDAVLASTSANFYGHPSRKLRLLGVTGTNGKTTVTHLCSVALDQICGCGVLGTLGMGRPGQLAPSVHTTPELNVTNAVLARCVDAGCDYAVMEVSSHGINQRRIEGLVFDTALYTNLSHDHLDYHGDMAAYAATKARLFRQPGLRSAVVNADDAYAPNMTQDITAQVMFYSLENGPADNQVSARLKPADVGIALELDGPLGRGHINSMLMGRFNAYNLLAAATALAGLGLPMHEVCERLGDVAPAPGRMQWLGGGDLPVVVVDYSHTPDALEKALGALRETSAGQLWCVFGCGGERDTGKRPRMGRIAEQYADHVVITDDNPRGESSARIIAQILEGMRAPDVAIVEADRAAAINLAVSRCQPGDIVLIAGKGHEAYQERNSVRSPFSDLDEAAQALQRRARNGSTAQGRDGDETNAVVPGAYGHGGHADA